jgi:tRNA A-37 threonylcarbamoyl transferase component Bud32
MRNLLINPNQAFSGKLLKADPTTTLTICQIDGKNFVVKRYNIKGFWHGLKRSISPSRAVKCWRNAHRLLALNITTPKPIAIIEKRFGPFRQEAYFIYEFVSGTISSDIFTSRITQQKNFSLLAEKIVFVIKQILDANLSHGDLKTANFIFNHDQVFLIDLDALRRHFWPFMRRRAKTKNIQRFLANWPDDPALQNLMQKKITEIL